MVIDKVQNIFFYVILILSVILFLYIIYPFLGALVVALTLFIIFKPLYLDISRHLKKHPSWSSALTVILIIIIVAIPLSFLITSTFNEIRGVYENYTLPGQNYSQSWVNLTNTLSAWRDHYVPWATIDFANIRGLLASWFFSNFSSIFSSIVSIIFNVFIIVMALYYLFKDGDNLKSKIKSLSPLDNEKDENIIKKIEGTIISVIRGSLLVSLLQGLAIGFGFAVFGIPQPILWGAVVAVAALIPSVGTYLVVIPAIAYLALIGQYSLAFGLGVWGIIFMYLIGNILGPYLMVKGTEIHPFLIFMAVIGGLEFFGPLGFLLGPIILSLSLALLDIYAGLIKAS